LHLRRVELIEHRVAAQPLVGALTGKLRVQLRLRPQVEAGGRREALLELARRETHDRSDRIVVGRAAARRLVDHVHGIALLLEPLRPALAPVRRTGEVGPGLGRTMDHDDRVRLGLALGNAVLDVHLPLHERTGLGLDVAPADEEVPLSQRCVRVDGCAGR
jgi:hypothetical protein